MYQFLKTHLSFLMCFLVILMGCTNRKISREFSDTMKDGSRVVIKIAYKPKSVMNSKGEKFGSYYFIFKMQEQKNNNPELQARIRSSLKHYTQEKVRNSLRKAGYSDEEIDVLLLRAISRIIYISFYDREGHLLLNGFRPDGLAMNFTNHEENIVDGGIEWKGQFDERIITVENFRDIHSITVEWR